MKKSLTLTALFFFCFSFSAIAASFNDFLKEQEGEFVNENKSFDSYQKIIDSEFEAYSRMVVEEYDLYRSAIKALWPLAEVSDSKKWVEYWPDYHTKRAVDFEKGFISIGVIPNVDEDVEARLQRVLEDMLLEDSKTAFERDRVASSVERRLRETSKNFKGDVVKRKPILAPVVLGKELPPKDEVKKIAASMIKKGEIEKSPSAIKGRDIVSIKMPLS